ncbi:Chromate resistance protein ChrB [Actinopolymorpha alba]|uniref:Chromate resistance protein ChrB n=1 Tax=Actinopolymorpha alba TaxID=533267 RepID=UPI000372A256|nr:Chromate resistance protein ChrB [Actinopolymorpha alba]
MATGEWVLLSYRLPREPSTPRITVWRKLKRLGVAQLGDGLVALPADARTREQVEWLAEEISQAGGEAGIWLAHPAASGQEKALASELAAARAAEYAAVAAEARRVAAAPERERQRVGTKLGAELRRISQRDYFPPPERESAHAAVRALLEAPTPTSRRRTARVSR